jgi:hypothetical protein
MSSEMSKLKLYAVILHVWYHDNEDGPTEGFDVLQSLTHEQNNQEELIAWSMTHSHCFQQ